MKKTNSETDTNSLRRTANLTEVNKDKIHLRMRFYLGCLRKGAKQQSQYLNRETLKVSAASYGNVKIQSLCWS